MSDEAPNNPPIVILREPKMQPVPDSEMVDVYAMWHTTAPPRKEKSKSTAQQIQTSDIFRDDCAQLEASLVELRQKKEDLIQKNTGLVAISEESALIVKILETKMQSETIAAQQTTDTNKNLAELRDGQQKELTTIILAREKEKEALIEQITCLREQFNEERELISQLLRHKENILGNVKEATELFNSERDLFREQKQLLNNDVEEIFQMSQASHPSRLSDFDTYSHPSSIDSFSATEDLSVEEEAGEFEG